MPSQGARPWSTGACHIYVGVKTRLPTSNTEALTDSNLGLIGGEKTLAAAALRAAEAAASSQASVRLQQAAYLGTAEISPDVQIRPVYRRINTDASGGVNGMGEDEAYLGEEAIVSATLTRWNEQTYAAIAARPAAATGRGLVPERGIGSLMVREGLAYPLWLYWPYWAKQIVTVSLPGVTGGSVGGAAVTGGMIATPAGIVRDVNSPAQSHGGGGSVPFVLSLLANAVRLGTGMPPGIRFLKTYLVAPERIYPMGTRPKKIHLIWRAQMELRGAEVQRVGVKAVDDRRSSFVLYDFWMKDLPDPE